MYIPHVFRDPRFPLAVVQMAEQDDMGLHYHPYVELVLIQSGTGLHLAQDHALTLTAGQIFVIPPGFAHGYDKCQNLRLVNICFEPHELDLPLAVLRRLPGYQALFAIEPHLRDRYGFAGYLSVTDDVMQGLCERADALASELRQRAAGFELAATTYVQQFLIAVCRHYQAQRGDEVADVLRVSELLARIDRHMAESMSVARLSGWAQVSAATVQRWFHARFGCSASAYVTRVRMDRARSLLLHSDATIASIGAQVGVSDHNYFTRLFRRHHGMAPLAWRQAHRV